MDSTTIEEENERLRASWNCIPIEQLATYLGIEEQDQRINTHSILTRALLADTLWPGRFDALIDEELRFGVVMTWLLQELRAGATRMELLGALAGAPKGRPIPAVVRQAAAWLQTDACPLPDYVTDALVCPDPDQPEWHLSEPAMNTFARLWSSQLHGLASQRIDVLEIACGSGNDYGALRQAGLAEHLSYSGLDISWKNIANARHLYPGVNFFETSVLNSGLPDNSFDYIFLHDVIGHLSLEALEVALAEIMRIVRKEAWLHCFNIADIERHEVYPYQQCCRNRLSIPRVRSSLERAGASVEVVLLSDLLERKFHCRPAYTATCGSFLARKG